ncbi:MAG: hypothetical protein ABJN51_13500, partial [Sneathiella sp.]
PAGCQKSEASSSKRRETGKQRTHEETDKKSGKKRVFHFGVVSVQTCGGIVKRFFFVFMRLTFSRARATNQKPHQRGYHAMILFSGEPT